jgi:hypothetical protein
MHTYIHTYLPFPYAHSGFLFAPLQLTSQKTILRTNIGGHLPPTPSPPKLGPMRVTMGCETKHNKALFV